MWEQIRANKRKSVGLVLLMAVLLVVLGFVIGQAILYQPFELWLSGDAALIEVIMGGLFGAAIAAGIWAVMASVAYFSGGRILLAVGGARRIEKQDHPQLFNVVEEMTIASGLPKMPDVYIIDDPALNAFATGRDPRHSAVAVTSGLLQRLNRDQLQGVVAHEIAHIVNRDVLLMQMLGVMLGAIVMISEIFLRGLFYSGGHRRRSRSSSGGGGGQAQLILMVVAVVLAILAPILAHMIYFASSRRREYLADAQATVFTRYPEGLASALEAISGDAKPVMAANRATAPMYISNPLAQKLNATGAFTTHPPINERVRILRSMSGAASYAAYERAASAAGVVSGMPASALAASNDVPIRAADPSATRKVNPKRQQREAGDALRSAGQFAFIPCACGLRIKLPPNFNKKKKIGCPKCGRSLSIPVAGVAALDGLASLSGEPRTAKPRKRDQKAPMTVKRKGSGWMSFNCRCGNLVNLSPSFSAEQAICSRCQSPIRIIVS